jgi:ADP-ribosylglycohydrolase
MTTISLEQVKLTAENLCKTTHFDPRCISSCLAVCLTIAYLLRNEFDVNDIELLVKRVQKETIDTLGQRFNSSDQEQFIWYTEIRTLEELNLDESSSIGYTYKCLGAGFYGLRSTETFENTLNALIRYGGDADTNGAVCGTMFGARYGYTKLPYEWLRHMPYKKWFDKRVFASIEKMMALQNFN